MAKNLISTAYDNINFNETLTSTPIVLTTAVAKTLPDNLELEVTDSDDLIEIKGQLTFKLATKLALDTSSNPTPAQFFLSTVINVNRDSANGDLVCTLQDTKPYYATTAEFSNVIWTLPIRGIDEPKIMVTTNDVKYYVTVTVTLTSSTGALVTPVLTLQQYCISANEIPECNL